MSSNENKQRFEVDAEILEEPKFTLAEAMPGRTYPEG